MSHKHLITVTFVMDEMDDPDPYYSAEILADLLWPEYGDTFEIVGATIV